MEPEKVSIKVHLLSYNITLANSLAP